MVGLQISRFPLALTVHIAHCRPTAQSLTQTKMSTNSVITGISIEYLEATTAPASVYLQPPDPRMSPADFISLSLPSLLEVDLPNGDPTHIFSSKAPNYFPSRADLTNIPIPSCAPRLAQACLSQFNLGSRSITLSIDGNVQQLPLWIADLWAPVLSAVQAQPRWKAAHTWCQARILSVVPDHPEFSHIPQAVALFFSTIGWNIRIKTPSGGIDSLQLTDFFSNKYLTGELMDQMIHLLQFWMIHVPGVRRDIFLDSLDFQNPFIASVHHSISWDAFDDNRPGQLTHLRHIADEIRSGNVTTVICPLHDARLDHYVAARLDIHVDSTKLSIGDSLNNRPRDAIDKGVHDGFQRFSNKLGRPLSDSLTVLSHSVQRDCYSCGIVTCNTIERAIFPNVRPWSFETKDFERVEFALLLATQLGSRYALVSFVRLSLLISFVFHPDESYTE